MQEWKPSNVYNSYNCVLKGMYYKEWYEAILKWRNTHNPKDLLPPIEVSLDASPNGACSARCKWCNFDKYLEQGKTIPNEFLLEVINFTSDWGAKSFCVGGGGDSTLRSNLSEILYLIKDKKKQSAVVSNGILFNDKLIDSMASCCRWIGVSVDCSNKETYKKYKGVDAFDRVINNIKKICKKVKELNTNCDVSFKFLVSNYNYNEVYEACKIAKDLGVKDFHVRGADLNHQGLGEKRNSSYQFPIKEILESYEKCHELETEDFRVFSPTHKFDNNFKPYKNFKQCYTMPLLLQCCPDGNIYSCVDQRMQKDYLLGSYYPNLENIFKFWGGEKHYNLVFGNTPKICSTKCTFTSYNETCEKIFVEEEKDYMCKYFT